MKADLSFLDDYDYEDVVAEWEEYSGVSTYELMEKYDTTEIDSTVRYAKKVGIMNLIEFYHLNDLLNALREYILCDDEFKNACTCDNFQWAVDMFLDDIENQLLYENCTYFLPEPDQGVSWFRVDCHGDSVYWNIDEIWVYWSGLNKENYFEQ